MLINGKRPSFQKFIVYRHTLNRKHYIGQTSLELSRRKGDTKFSSYRYSKMFYRAIKKYGVENIVSEILYVCKTQDEADRLEKLSILRYNTISPNGYNIEQGGKRNKSEKDGKVNVEGEKEPFDIFLNPIDVFS